MAATSGSEGTAKTQCVKKVSKPLMEKKRRARINKCLNQLKSLLESVCSNSIRKRKLEKADILELTVKHLRHLQSTERGMVKVCDSAEYHTGYRRCLVTVSNYLLASDTDRDSRSTMLSHLASGPKHAAVPDFSTAESDPARILAPTSSFRRSHKVALQTDASYPTLQQTSNRNDCFMPRRIKICDMDRISFDTPGAKKLKTTHFQNSVVDERCSLKNNYWRPW